MRIGLSFLFLLVYTSLFSQLIDLKKPWLSQEPFFNEEFIKENHIQAVHFRIRNKKDGEIMSKNSTFIHFVFDTNAKVISSFQSLPLSKRIDTSRINYTYNHIGNCIERIEERGEFLFKYTFEYNDKNERIREFKIDTKRENPDTLYRRYFNNINTKSNKIIAVLNASKDEFMSFNYSYEDEKLIKEVVRFKRNQNRIKKSYFYENNNITERTYAKNYGNKTFEKWEISYNKEKADLIKVFKNGSLLKKIKFSYSDLGKLNALIERNFEDESITLIEISYYYF